MENQPIVFAYWKDNEFQGFRADTFNTISKEYAKVYQYSKEQVAIVVGNVQSGCNKIGQSLAKALSNKNVQLLDVDGNLVESDLLEQHMKKTEDKFREWEQFELRVHPFIPAEEWYGLGEGDEWKRKKIIEELPLAIEIYKFMVLSNEN